MCELFAMSASAAATVNMSLAEFSRHGGLSGPHKDGWGIAYYEGKDVRLIRDTEPASSSQWARFVSDCALSSPTVISHIRKATDGTLSLSNTQPFVRELGGRMHVFAHNGHVPSVREDKSFAHGMHRPVGTTDSEHSFCALLARLEPLWLTDEPPPVAYRQHTIEAFAEDLQEHGLANFIYSDGELLVAHGHRRNQPDGSYAPPGLHVLTRKCSVSAGSVSTAGLSVTAGDVRVVLIASVPLTTEEWRPLGEGEIVSFADGVALDTN